MKIQIIGSGCTTCKNLHKAVEEVVNKLNLNIAVEYSTDITKIIELGALSSPVFAIDGELIASGKVPTDQEIENAILSKSKGKIAKEKKCNGNCSCGNN